MEGEEEDEEEDEDNPLSPDEEEGPDLEEGEGGREGGLPVQFSHLQPLTNTRDLPLPPSLPPSLPRHQAEW